MKYLYVSFFLILCMVSARGQTDSTLLAAKKDNKWGYINKNKEWIIAPMYESTIPFNTTEITWATFEGQSLLIDRTGKHIEHLDFDNVTEIYDNIILYRENNKNGWYNRNTRKLYKASHQSIDYLESLKILIVQDSGKAQLFNEEHAAITDTLYDDITDLGTYLYATQGKLHGVINTQGSEIVEVKYQNIKQSGDFLLAQDTESMMHVFSMEGQALLSGRFDNVNHLLGSYFATKKKNHWNLEDASSNTVMDSIADSYSILSADYVLIIKNNLRGIFNLNTGEVIMQAEFTDIRPLKGSKRLAASKNNKYALFSYTGEKLTEHIFHGISDFDSLGSAKTYHNNKVGLIDSTGFGILTTTYSSISLGSDRVAKGRNENGVTLYEFDNQWQIIDSLLFKKAMTMQLGGVVSMEQNLGTDASDFSQNTMSDGWYRDTTFRWGYKTEDGRILLRPVFNSIEKIQGTEYVLGIMNTFKKNGLSHTSELIQKKQYGLINEEDFKVLTPLNLKYLDIKNLTDTSTQVYRVMLSSGHMATVRKDNHRLIHYQSRYIGQFVNGYARIFIGTKIRVTSRVKKYPTIIGTKDYAREFGFKYKQARAFSKEERFECDGYWAYLGPDGKFIMHPEYFKEMKLEVARDFKKDRAIVRNSGGYGLINHDGNFVLTLAY
ncbi:MAG: WG repeat-containing protein, partial [Bacteroidia bacterium]